MAEKLVAEEAELAAMEAECKRKRARVEVLRRQACSGTQVGFLQASARATLPNMTTLLMLSKWNTPTIFNGWEQVTTNPMFGRECFNLEPVTDHMPQMGTMVGFAVTCRIKPGDLEVARLHGSGRQRFRDHMATLPPHLPKIVVVQDDDKPLILGSMWGEVNASYFRSVGAVGCLVDGGVRDIDEMTQVGFHAMSRGVCIGHSFGGIPVEWDVPVTVFGVTVRPSQLIHADKHGFLVVPEADEAKLLEASEFMDALERKHTVVPGREGTGQSVEAITAAMGKANAAFGKEKTDKYGSYDSRFPAS